MEVRSPGKELNMAARVPLTGAPAVTAKKSDRLVPALDRAIAAWMQIPFLLGSAVLLIGSIFLPYWNIVLRAPQYPKGLSVDVYVYKLEDLRSVREVDGLNHYIGMIKLTDAATVERATSVYAIPLIAVLAVASIFVTGRWRTLLRIPVLIYPVVFVIDLFAWLYYAGHSLDSTAALSSSITEFTPRIIGTGVIGQFSTEARFEWGFWMAVASSVLVAIAIYLDWRMRRHGKPS
jgi:hypothetical protein